MLRKGIAELLVIIVIVVVFLFCGFSFFCA